MLLWVRGNGTRFYLHSVETASSHSANPWLSLVFELMNCTFIYIEHWMGGWLVCYNVGWMGVCCENERNCGRTVVSAVGCQPRRVFRLFVDSVVKTKAENVIRRVTWNTETAYSIHCTEDAVRRKNDTGRSEIKQGTRNGVLSREGNYSTVSVGKPARILVAARFKVWACGRSLVGIVGSNRAGGIDVCSEWWCLSGSRL